MRELILLYWYSHICFHTQVIECADLNGQYRRILVTSVPHPYGLTVAGNFLYWTDWQTRAIHRANKDTGLEIEVIVENLSGLMDVHAVQIGNVGKNLQSKKIIIRL